MFKRLLTEFMYFNMIKSRWKSRRLYQEELLVISVVILHRLLQDMTCIDVKVYMMVKWAELLEGMIFMLPMAGSVETMPVSTVHTVTVLVMVVQCI